MTIADWWTPSGFERRDPPKEWAEADGKEWTNWDAFLKAAKLEHVFETSGEHAFEAMRVEVMRNPDTHCHAVNIDSINGTVAWIWVAAEHWAEFATTRLPDLVRAAVATHAENDAMLKAFAAFVRHGHGQDVLNEDGTETLEERRRREYQRYAAADKKAKGAAA